jgi:hypothetical protein
MKKTLILLALALCSSLAAAQTYKCVSNGKTSYQATPCETGKDVQASTLKSASGNWQGSGNLSCDSPKDVMSISFHDMPLRQVLQLIADFSGQKLVADTSISGNAAFQYQNRPWCEILADVSRRHQLEVRAEGGMLYAKRR